jgi:glycosyltransferase involved in cell wall biosynthesis
MTRQEILTMTIALIHAAKPAGSIANRPRLRVCHLSMTLRTGGLERLLVEFARCHDASQFDLSFVALGELGPPAENLRHAGYDVRSLGLPHVGKSALIKSLASHLRDARIDVLHTHNTYPHFYGTLAARWAGVPTVVNSQHGRGCGGGWKGLWQFRLANRLASAVVGVSEDATALCRREDPLSTKAMCCIWNGIDVDRFRFTGPRQAPVAISVARLSSEKDYPTLLRAVALLVRDVPEFRLLLVGDGAERARLEQLSRDLKIEKHVDFLGERQDVPELLAQAGFYVSSSKTEGISLTLLEAMAVGLPIVTTRVGGNPEIVQEGVTGKLVEPLNPDALAASMRQMICEMERWPAIALASRARVETNFNVRQTVSRYEDLYRRVHSSR